MRGLTSLVQPDPSPPVLGGIFLGTVTKIKRLGDIRQYLRGYDQGLGGDYCEWRKPARDCSRIPRTPSCPLWVKSGRSGVQSRCPLCAKIGPSEVELARNLVGTRRL